ncbi:MAG: VWA domain-containing protein [Spirochaetales bacterium]|nr:VWA domain-containing protein [Spirochaetales bacterium]
MKKVLLCAILLLVGILAWSNTTDLVVLLDTSESMFGEFDSTVNYLIRDIIKNTVSINYTFHLILFDSYTNVDYVQKIEEPEDGAKIINHLALIHPFGKYTDLIEALSTLLSYGNNLPAGNDKNIVILTDGIHDPPPGKYSGDGKEEIRELTDKLSRTGWNINIVPLEGGELSAKEAGDYFTTESGTSDRDGKAENNDVENLSQQLNADLVDPDSIEGQMVLTGGVLLEPRKTDYRSKNQKLKLRFKAENFNAKELEITVLDVLHQSRNILEQPVSFSVAARDGSSFSLDVDFGGFLTAGNSQYRIKLSVMASAPVSPLVYDLTVKFREFSFVLDVLPLLLIIIAIIGIVILVIAIVRTRSRIQSGVRDDEDRSYTVLGLKKDTKNKKASQDRVFPYEDSEMTRVKGTVYYPETKKASAKSSTPSYSDRTMLAESSFKNTRKQAPEATDKTVNTAPSSKKNGIPSKVQPDVQASKDILSSDGRQEHDIDEEHAVATARARSHTRNIKYLLMLNVNTPFNPIMAGTRVQRLDKDRELTLGSGNSSFYLYFSKMLPGVIASIRFNGNRCSFIPHDFKYFPDLKSPLDDCINQKIRIVNGHEEQIITFKEWLSPLEEINRIMHLIDYRGLPKSPFDEE